MAADQKNEWYQSSIENRPWILMHGLLMIGKTNWL